VTRRYLLDTNILSDLIKHPQGACAQMVGLLGEASICTSVVAAAELRFGAVKKGSTLLNDKVDALLSVFETLPLAHPVDEVYAHARAHMERAGAIIGANDMLIAAHALAANLVLVTDNEKEFSLVPKLKIENWLRS
jgi:tRNA(fMet)-specific endonuclease VapC